MFATKILNKESLWKYLTEQCSSDFASEMVISVKRNKRKPVKLLP